MILCETLQGIDVLIIGSDRGLSGLGLGSAIDRGDYGLVVRCNKPYGAAEDVGRGTDVIFLRYFGWLAEFWGGMSLAPLLPVVAINEGSGMLEAEREQAGREMGVKWPSCGACAAYYFVTRGASVTLMGFGDGGAKKIYADGTVDNNSNYDWGAERRFYERYCKFI